MIKQLIVRILGLPAYICNSVNLKLNKVVLGTNNRISGIMRLNNKGKIEIGSGNVIFCSPKTNHVGASLQTGIYCSRSGSISIGDNCEMSNFVINCSNRIEIGNKVMVGGGCNYLGLKLSQHKV